DLGGEIFSNTGKNVRILNNILYANSTEIVNFDYMNDATVLYDYNIYYNGTASPSYGRPLANNVIADPLFVNPAGRDFHLQAGSPAINSGTTLVTDPLLNKDYDNNTRPYAGTLPDRGAFETTTGGPANLTVQAESFCLQSGLTSWSTGIGDFSPGDYAKYCSVNLGTGYNRLTFNLATTQTGTIYVRLGSPTGTTVGTFNFTSTGDWGTYGQQTISLSGASGTQDVYRVGSSGTINLDWIQFSNVAVTSLTVQAESFCTQTGLTSWSTGIGDFSPGDYAKYCSVSLGTGYNRLTFNVGTVQTGTIYVRLGSPTGTTVGTFNFTSTGDWGTYQEQTITLTGASGTQDVYLVGGSGTLNLDWIRFSNSSPARFAAPDAGALAAYPNPARTVLHIPLPANHGGAGRVVLTDVLGRRVVAEAAMPGGNLGEMQLDVSRVGKGTYLLTVTHEGGRRVSRVAIVR
ncbi:MAG TPA: carbohydrate-binding protein, partial [Cytophagales bacterium]